LRPCPKTEQNLNKNLSSTKEYQGHWERESKYYFTSSVIWWVIKLTALFLAIQNTFYFHLNFTCTLLVYLIRCQDFPSSNIHSYMCVLSQASHN
jgi:hypothetical protein